MPVLVVSELADQVQKQAKCSMGPGPGSWEMGQARFDKSAVLAVSQLAERGEMCECSLGEQCVRVLDIGRKVVVNCSVEAAGTKQSPSSES